MNMIPDDRQVTHGELQTIISSFIACDDELDERLDNAARQFMWLRDYVMCLDLIVKALADDDDDEDTE